MYRWRVWMGATTVRLRVDGAAHLVLPDDAVATLEPQVEALASAAGDTLEGW